MKNEVETKATGSVQWVPATRKTPGHYAYRLSLVDGSRPWVHCTATVRSELAEKRVREVALERAREAMEKKLTAEDFGLKKREAVPGSGGPAKSQTMAEWLTTWGAARRSRGLTSVRENEAHYTKHVEPIMGESHVRDWTSDDMRKLAAALDRKVQDGEIAWKTAWNVWATATGICRDACASKIEALRVRADNPARDVEGPDRGASKSKQYIYPSEFLRFVSCEDVPLRWRRQVALAIYLFPRAGELRVLRWEDVDLEHATIHSPGARPDERDGRDQEHEDGARSPIRDRAEPAPAARGDARGEGRGPTGQAPVKNALDWVVGSAPEDETHSVRSV